jgi:hypothetical protein
MGGLGSGPHRLCFAGGRGPPTRNYALGTPNSSQTRCLAFGVPFLRKKSRFEASPSGSRPPPLVPGLFWFRARVILLADDPTPRWEMPARPRTQLPTETALPLHPTRPKPRLPMPEQTLPFPPPEPPLLWAVSAFHVLGGKLGTWHAAVRVPLTLRTTTFVQQSQR